MVVVSLYIYIYTFDMILPYIACIYCISEKHQSRREIDPKLRKRAISRSFLPSRTENKDTPPNTTKLWFYTKKIGFHGVSSSSPSTSSCFGCAVVHSGCFRLNILQLLVILGQGPQSTNHQGPEHDGHRRHGQTWWLRTGEANSELLLICPVSGGRIEKTCDVWCISYMTYMTLWSKIHGMCPTNVNSHADLQHAHGCEGRQRMRADGQGPLNYNRPFNSLLYIGLQSMVSGDAFDELDAKTSFHEHTAKHGNTMFNRVMKLDFQKSKEPIPCRPQGDRKWYQEQHGYVTSMTYNKYIYIYYMCIYYIDKYRYLLALQNPSCMEPVPLHFPR